MPDRNALARVLMQRMMQRPQLGPPLPSIPMSGAAMQEPNLWQPEERNPFAGMSTYDWKHPGFRVQPVGFMERNLFPPRGGPKVSDWAKLNSTYEKY
jgi:hypothetical protein